MTDNKSVIFPIFGNFPNVLHIGESNKVKADISNKKILFILDCTGSMGDFINEHHKNSKMVVAKQILEKVVNSKTTNDYDIMLFNENPYPLCKIEGIVEPNNCTYFSPLVPAVKDLMKTDKNYCSVIFMSDGLPSESPDVAHDSIKTIGSFTRENKCNPVSVAVGTDADGVACGLFAGNRGYNCFIKYEEEVEGVVKDIVNGINCNYHMLPNGAYIPVESDNKYYYVSDNIADNVNNTIKPTKFFVEKFLNLVIMMNINDTNKIKLLKSYVDICVKLLDDETERKEICNKFDKLLTMVRKTIIDFGNTPSIVSRTAQVYRTGSNQV